MRGDVTRGPHVGRDRSRGGGCVGELMVKKKARGAKQEFSLLSRKRGTHMFRNMEKGGGVGRRANKPNPSTKQPRRRRVTRTREVRGGGVQGVSGNRGEEKG